MWNWVWEEHDISPRELQMPKHGVVRKSMLAPFLIAGACGLMRMTRVRSNSMGVLYAMLKSLHFIFRVMGVF